MTNFLARMISHTAKWRSVNSSGEVPADAVVRDLWTDENALSFWCCDHTNPESLDTVAIALASNRDRLDRLDLVCISEAALRRLALDVTANAGDTPVVSINHLHRDVGGINMTRLSELAHLIHEAVHSAAVPPLRYSKLRIRELLVGAIGVGLLKREDLKPSLAQSLPDSL